MNEERFERLCEAWADSRLTPEEAAELSALLRREAAARDRFRAAAAFHAHLHAAADSLTLDAATASQTVAFPTFSRPLGLVAALLAVGLTVSSFGWLLAARSDRAETRPLEIADGGFELIKGSVSAGFPSRAFSWGGDPSEVVTLGDHPTTLRFLEAAGEPNVPNSPRQSCDVFQIVDLRGVRDRLLNSEEAFAELQVSLRDVRPSDSEPVRFIVKIYAFEGEPGSIVGQWPPAPDRTLGSGAQFHVSRGGRQGAWRTLTARCVLPPDAGFLVVQIGVGNAGEPGRNSPGLGSQFADDVRLTLRTRAPRTGIAAR